MWAAASAVERARKAFATVSQLEEAVSREPTSRALQINLSAARKFAEQTQARVLELAEQDHVEVCNYRLLPAKAVGYALASVSSSLLGYQNLFSQIHDAIRNGPKLKAVIGAEAMEESLLEFGYSYSGSLGVVLFVPSEKTLLDGTLDASIDALFQVVDLSDQHDVRDIARTLGTPVLKRVYDWSESNAKGGFSADLKWRRSDGRQLGELITLDRMQRMVEVIGRTSDVETINHRVTGVLVGLDVKSGRFRLTVPDGEDFVGMLGDNFPRMLMFTVNRPYDAHIVESRTTRYATETVERKFALVTLQPPLGDAVAVESES
ncbi:hypothetical protein [Mesorhizobium sp. B1-1-8]|uniref:hypothetical protein n=1 Tax=Mesorhizobium sp. B1-1-8 TaxID=2589976 RepID=UPI00112A148F|nr:hypothetical protein [Mesorhizobium sp. B1-1-8]UCI06304.1 hypothetical protein FJ974_21150 [Mesorhizobium sp. B1-1-8]